MRNTPAAIAASQYLRALVFLAVEHAIWKPEGCIVGDEGRYSIEVPAASRLAVGVKEGFELMPQLYPVVYGNGLTLLDIPQGVVARRSRSG